MESLRLRLASAFEWGIAAAFLAATLAVFLLAIQNMQAPASPAAVTAMVGRTGETGREEADRGRLGQRLTRFYEYAGFRFIVVFEPFERRGEPRASAIYLP